MNLGFASEVKIRVRKLDEKEVGMVKLANGLGYANGKASEKIYAKSVNN